MLRNWRTGWVAGDGFGTSASVFLAFTTPWWAAFVAGLLTLLATGVTALMWNTLPGKPDELVISSSGILFTGGKRGPYREYSFPWHHVSAVGIMTPMLPNPRPPTKPMPAPQPSRSPSVLAVRLRPEVPDPAPHSGLLTEDHNKLGYFGICRLDAVDAGLVDIRTALERFAGARGLRSAREFLAADPRLRPDMV